MPLVARDLGGLELYGWVFAGYSLASLVGIVVLGGLIDTLGLVRPFVLGLAIFGAGLVGGGLAPSMPALVAARFVQGLGGGSIAPVAYVAIGRALPDRLRPAMFATLSTAWVVPGIVGPALAGFVAETIGWRFVFLGIVPLVVLGGWLTVSALTGLAPAERASRAGAPAAAGRPDGEVTAGDAPRTDPRRPARPPVGTALALAAGAALALQALSIDGPVLVPLVLAGVAILGLAFARLAPPGTLRLAPGLPAAILLRGLLTFGFFGAAAYVPLALEDWRHLPASVAGLALTAATLTWTAGSWTQARGIGRYGPRAFIGAGFAIAGVGVVATAAVLHPAVPWPAALLTWGVAGFGMGLAYSPLSIVVLREAPSERAGAATSALTLSDQLGGALGTGVAGAIVAAGIRAGLELGVPLAAVFALGGLVAAAGFAASGRTAVGAR